jgi:hypothetical protein
MTIEQTVEIPPGRQLTIDIPPEIPEGLTVVALTPLSAPPRKSGGKIHLTRRMVAEMMRDEALRSLTGILHTDMPLEEIRAERLGKYDHIS